jgi:hypothetical protein
LTFEVEQFLPLSVRRGQSACTWRSVRGYSVLRMFVVFLLVFVFRSGFVLGFYCSQFADGLSFSSGRSGTRADSPPGLRGRSVFPGASLVVLVAFSDCPWHPAGLSAAPGRLCGLSAALGRTVCVVRADSPPLLAGQSARAWQLCSLVRFFPPFFRASACA